MTEQKGKSVVEASIQAVVIRKDGTVEDLGTVSYWHRNPIKRLIHRLQGQGKIKQGDC